MVSAVYAAGRGRRLDDRTPSRVPFAHGYELRAPHRLFPAQRHLCRTWRDSPTPLHCAQRRTNRRTPGQFSPMRV